MRVTVEALLTPNNQEEPDQSYVVSFPLDRA
jgi:hypothetical protein